MIARRKYQILISLSILLFAYVLMNDVSHRWIETFNLFHTLRQKESTVFEPDQMVEKKTSLLQRKTRLARIMTKDSKRFDQNQTGVFEFLTTVAQQSGVALESLVPVVSKSKGELREIGFKVKARASYHKIGGFINELESGPFGISMQKVDLERGKDATVGASIEGIAYVLSTGGSQ
jgi:Tfp pilus assembly protein PilO